ncbi:MAG: hypothetical protein M1836_000821 [Candelina mexicana]|nr:MAG: hypothetical protein M1836_000821 [Candelina mexicana]
MAISKLPLDHSVDSTVLFRALPSFYQGYSGYLHDLPPNQEVYTFRDSDPNTGSLPWQAGNCLLRLQLSYAGISRAFATNTRDVDVVEQVGRWENIFDAAQQINLDCVRASAEGKGGSMEIGEFLEVTLSAIYSEETPEENQFLMLSELARTSDPSRSGLINEMLAFVQGSVAWEKACTLKNDCKKSDICKTEHISNAAVTYGSALLSTLGHCTASAA